jgi:peptidoglycan/LPS O-acetylase OafA/YrhL
VTNGSAVRRLGHRRALDGLRALAFGMVFLDHSRLVPSIELGQVSMYVFLSLSGFLITAQLVGEHGKYGRIGLRAFYGRRARRLLPALGALLAIWFVVVVVFNQSAWTTSTPSGGPGGPQSLTAATQGIVGALAYVTNWFDIFHVYSARMPLGHLWSLTVQEQFYLVWTPLLVVLLCRFRRLVVPVALGLTALSLGEAILLLHGGVDWMRIYIGTDTRASAMLLGCALAVWWSEGKLDLFRRRHLGAVPGVVAIVALVWCTRALAGPHASPRELVAWVVGTLAGAIFVVSVVERERSPVSRFLGSRVMVYLGRRSYALYLWHYVWLTWFRSLGLTGVVLAMLASLACAELSWRLVESRFLAHGRRGNAPATPGPSTTMPMPPEGSVSTDTTTPPRGEAVGSLVG